MTNDVNYNQLGQRIKHYRQKVCTPLWKHRSKEEKGTEDEYTPYHFYACNHRLRVDGKPCTFRKNINKKTLTNL